MRIFLVIGFCILSFCIYSQAFVLPFLNGDKYSVVDQNGKEILPAEYDDLIAYNDYKLMALLKDELWGIFTLDGKKILDHKIGKRNRYQEGLVIKKTFHPISTGGVSNNYPNGLLTVTDNFAKINYYINPNKLLTEYKPYSAIEIKDKNEPNYLTGLHNIEKVKYRNHGFNFIDSIGQELFKAPVSNGFAINENLIVLSKNKKYALYNKTESLTDFVYNRISTKNLSSIIVGFKKEVDSSGYEIKVSDLYQPDGSLIAASVENYSFSYKHLLINNRKKGYDLYTRSLKLMMSQKNGKGSFVKLGKNFFIIVKTGDNQGLMDMKGNFVLDTIYNLIMAQGGLLTTRGENFAAVLDTNLQEVIRMDSVKNLYKDHRSDYFLIGQKENEYKYYGLVDKNKKEIISPIWREIEVHGCNELVVLKGDSTFHLRKIGSDKDILKVSKDRHIYINCKDQKINIFNKGKSIKYSLEGIIDGQSNPSNQTIFKVVKKGSGMILIDEEGLQILDKTYKKITTIKNPTNGKNIYLCQLAGGKIPDTEVYNDDLKRFVPDGYTVPGRWVYKMRTNLGALLVTNNGTTLDKFKTGMIDYNGNWLFEPINGMIEFIGKDIFMMTDYDKQSMVFYNSKGEILSDGEYDFISKVRRYGFFENRILVGTIENPKYKNKVRKIYENDFNYRSSRDSLIALGKPKIKYRFLNIKGEKLNDEIYDEARPYGKGQDRRTTVTKRTNGKVISQVIDLDGKVYFEAEVDELDFVRDDYYQGRVEDKWALMDTLGNAKTPFQFTSISRHKNSNHFEASMDKERFYISNDFKIIPLGAHEGIEIKTIDDYYFYITSSKSLENFYNYDSRKIIFDTEGNVIADLGYVYRIATKFNKATLPKGYVAVFPELKSKAIIYDLKNKKYLRK